MERTYINEAQKAIGGTVKVQGFIENLRNSKYMALLYREPAQQQVYGLHRAQGYYRQIADHGGKG